MPKGQKLYLAGTTINNWYVIRRVYGSKPSSWWCRCILCKAEQGVLTGNLRSGMSSGCRRCGYKQAAQKLGETRQTYGMSKTHAYFVFLKVKTVYPNHTWKDIKEFTETTKCNYHKGQQIIPKNKDLPIGPDNFVWVSRTYKELYKNKCARQWAKILGMTSEGIRRRMLTGLSLEEAVKQGKAKPGRKKGQVSSKTNTNMNIRRLYSFWYRNRNQMCPEWQSFKQLVEDTSPPSSNKNVYLRRKDNDKPFSKDNFFWANSSAQYFYQYRGKLLSFKELSKTRRNGYVNHRSGNRSESGGAEKIL